MKTLKPWLLLALVFFVGVFFGVVGTRLVVRRALREAVDHPARAQTVVERHLTRKLQLDPSQQVKLDVILSEAHHHMETIRQEFRPATAQVFSNANQQIREMLTPEQRVKFEKVKADNAVFLRGLQLQP